MGFYVGDKRASKLYLGDTLVYQDLVGKALWRQPYGGPLQNITNSLSWNANDGRWEASPTVNLGDTIYATMDGQAPAADGSNIVLFYMVTAKSGTFSVMLIGALFSDGYDTGALVLNL